MMPFALFLLCLIKSIYSINCFTGSCTAGQAAAGLCSFSQTTSGACGACQIRSPIGGFTQEAVCAPSLSACQAEQAASISRTTQPCNTLGDPACGRNIVNTLVTCCNTDLCNVPVTTGKLFLLFFFFDILFCLFMFYNNLVTNSFINFSLDPCASRRGCSECLHNADDLCGWCHDTKQCYNTYGAVPGTCNASFTETLTPGFTKTSDTLYQVTVHPGVATPVDVSWAYANNAAYSIPIKNDFDIFFLVDASGTLNPALTTIQGLQTQIANAVRSRFSTANPQVNVRIGLGSYIDIPQAPFGQEPYDYLFKIHQNMTSDYAAVATAYTNLIASTRPRNQDPEAVLSAILYAATRDNAISAGTFRPGVQPTPVPIGTNFSSSPPLSLFPFLFSLFILHLFSF